MLDRSRQYLGLSLIMGTPKSSCSNSVPHEMAILWGCSVAPHFQPLGSLIYFAWHFSMPWGVSLARDQRGQQNAPMLWSRLLLHLRRNPGMILA